MLTQSSPVNPVEEMHMVALNVAMVTQRAPFLQGSCMMLKSRVCSQMSPIVDTHLQLNPRL